MGDSDSLHLALAGDKYKPLHSQGSTIWLHAHLCHSEKGYVFCNYCDQKYGYKDSLTTSINNHLQKKSCERSWEKIKSTTKDNNVLGPFKRKTKSAPYELYKEYHYQGLASPCNH